MRPSRRRILALGGVSGAILATRVEAATPFTTFAFTGTGEPAARNQPDRIADVKNVKDFGAAGDGSTNDTTAIQNAVNWTNSANRGTIFFPSGTYIIKSPITFNTSAISICFLGQGNASTIQGSGFASSGYLLDRSLVSPSNTGQVIIEGLNFSTDAGNGCVRVGSCNNVLIRNCTFNSGPVSITTEDSPGVSSVNIFIQGCILSSGGLIMGGPGAVTGSKFQSCNVGAQMYGKGWFMGGNRAERNNTAYLIGLNSATAASFTGSIAAGTPPVLTTSSVTGTIGIGQQLRDLLSNVPGGVSIKSQVSGTAGGAGTYNLTNYPSLNVSSQAMTTYGVDVGASGFAINSGTTEGNWYDFDIAGTCQGFYIGDIDIIGHDNSNAGVTTGIQATQTSVWVRAAKASNAVFGSLQNGDSVAAVAGIQIDSATSRANLLFENCSFGVSSGGGTAWVDPGNAYTAWYLYSNHNPVWIFSQLPSGGNVLEGDEFSISDSTTNTWGANVTVGSGGDHILVRYNGSNYTVVAK